MLQLVDEGSVMVVVVQDDLTAEDAERLTQHVQLRYDSGERYSDLAGAA